MKIRKSGFQFEIKKEDLIKIKSVIEQWKDKWWSDNFDGLSLYRSFENWENLLMLNGVLGMFPNIIMIFIVSI